MELSRTLNSVLEGETGMTPEEILRDISRTITQGVDVNKKTLFEDYIYRNSSTSSGGKDSFSTEMNPINSRVYGKTETYLGLQNPSWSRSHCHRGKNSPSQDLLTTSYGKQTNSRFDDDQNRKKSSSGVIVVPENEGFFSRNIHCYNTKNSKICSCRRSENSNRVSNFKEKDNGNESARINNDKEQCNLRKEYPSANHEYATVSESKCYEKIVFYIVIFWKFLDCNHYSYSIRNLKTQFNIVKFDTIIIEHGGVNYSDF